MIVSCVFVSGADRSFRRPTFFHRDKNPTRTAAFQAYWSQSLITLLLYHRWPTYSSLLIHQTMDRGALCLLHSLWINLAAGSLNRSPYEIQILSPTRQKLSGATIQPLKQLWTPNTHWHYLRESLIASHIVQGVCSSPMPAMPYFDTNCQFDTRNGPRWR